MFDISKKKIWVAGHNGMVGSAIVRRLEDEDCKILKVGRKKINLKVLFWQQQKLEELNIICSTSLHFYMKT